MDHPQFELLEETETDRAWTWTAQRLHADGRLTRHEVRLAWADYDLWCDGKREPAVVAEAALAFLVRYGAELADRDRIDLSWVRRVSADADRVIPSIIA